MDKPLSLMEMTIETTAHVQKRMQTSATKAGDDQMVVCQIGVKGLRVTRDQMDELAGLPIGATGPLYNEFGQPMQRLSFLLPKRELLLSGKIEHRRESGATMAKLELKLAACADLRFNLDVPEDLGPMAMMSFTAHWKAAGDEVDDVKDLLAKPCYMKLTFREPPSQTPLPLGPDTSTVKPAAGARVELDRKRLASGEKALEVAGPAIHGPHPTTPKRKNGGLAKLERDAADHARKHPRRQTPKAKPARRY